MRNKKIYRFPAEVSSEEVPNYIRFEAKEFVFGGSTSRYAAKNNFRPQTGLESATSQNPVNNIDLTGGLSGVVDGLEDSIAGIAKQAVGGIIGQFKSLDISEIFSFANSFLKGKLKLNPRDLTDNLVINDDKVTGKVVINMYMPPGIVAQTGLDYGAEDLGAGGVAVANGAKQAGLNVSANDVGQVVVDEAKKFFNDNALIKAAQVGSGIAQNNFSYQIFNGVQHRSFTYDFTMVPRNEAEAVEIKKICDQFKYWSLPARSSNFEALYYEIPCIWTIGYYRQGNKMKYFDSPRECFLTSVNVAYNELSSNKIMEDGSPMDVKLSISFVEIEPEFRMTDNESRLGTLNSAFSDDGES